MTPSTVFFRCLIILPIFLLWSCRNEPTTSSEKLPTEVPVTVIELDTLPALEVEPLVYDYDTMQWTELIRFDSSIVLDMRYATTNNFVKEILYECERCFLRPEAARAVASANEQLKAQGYRLKMFDCFRPLPVQQRLWDKFQNPNYVTPPSKGSMHNRGLAVDLTIVDQRGEELDMGTAFDFFGQEAHHTYTGHSEEIQQNRMLLKTTLESFGFKGIRTEWWHYYFGGKRYELSGMVWACEE
jgi:D-alanyl-D-alanine dipeptidase